MRRNFNIVPSNVPVHVSIPYARRPASSVVKEWRSRFDAEGLSSSSARAATGDAGDRFPQRQTCMGLRVSGRRVPPGLGDTVICLRSNLAPALQ
jgi:hypothetical protein